MKKAAAALALAWLAAGPPAAAEESLEPGELAQLCAVSDPYALQLRVSMEGSSGGDLTSGRGASRAMSSRLHMNTIRLEESHPQVLKVHVSQTVKKKKRGGATIIDDWVYLIKTSFEVPARKIFDGGESRTVRATVWERVTYGNVGRDDQAALASKLAQAGAMHARDFIANYRRVNGHSDCEALRGVGA